MTEEMNPTNEREPNAAGQGPQPKEKLSFRQMYRKLLQLDDTPHSIALGAALGMFITFTPTVGIQVLIVLILSMVVRFNRFAAIVLIYLSNPVTIIPIYYADYVIACSFRENQVCHWKNSGSCGINRSLRQVKSVSGALHKSFLNLSEPM